MKYPEFISKVTERSALPRDEADAITRATLQTLGERITGGEARDLAAQLPKELQDDLASASEEAEPFDLEKFIRRVGERARVAPADARIGINAVFQTLEDAVSFGEFEDVMGQLPEEFGALAKPIILP
ncbi:MAG TPA: DUF2267 domain-containing protein [Actinoplanes sp.]|jgi:uncharacterized protein (DUF2267 family)|nr:DUF2267 domain-containing protein [Actinoplanes sp.]